MNRLTIKKVALIPLLLLSAPWSFAAETLPPVVEAGPGAGGTVNERLTRLERSNQVVVNLLSKIDRLQQEISELRGANEQLNYEIEGLKKRQRGVYLDIDSRLQRIEGGGQGAGAANNFDAGAPTDFSNVTDADNAAAGMNTPTDLSNGSDVENAAPSMNAQNDFAVQDQSKVPFNETEQAHDSSNNVPLVLVPATAQQRSQYTAAYNTLMAGNYSEAIDQLTDFLTKNPSTDLSDNAQYWLAEAYYVTRNFQAASDSFQRVIDIYPGSGKIPDASLKLGFIDYEMGAYDKAKQRLNQVVADYPGSSAARLAGNRMQQMRQEQR